MSTGTPGERTPGTPEGVPGQLLTQIEWLESVYLMRPVDIAPAPAGALAASRQVINGGANRLCGWSLIETTGAATASLRLRDGQSAQDQVITRIDLAAGESTRDYLDRHGLVVRTGMIWLELLSGSVEGTLWVR